MGWFSWFSRTTRPEDYEGVLARLASEINDAKHHLSEVRLRERRYYLLLNAYGVGLWAMWAGLWYFGHIPWGLVGWRDDAVEARAIGLGAVILGPVIILLLNHLVRLIFKRIRTNEETHLRLLLGKQRKQVDEIKKATNFDTTRKLLEQYDAGAAQLQRQQQQQQQEQQRRRQQEEAKKKQEQEKRSPTTPVRGGSNPNSPDSPLAGSPRSPTTPQTPTTPVPLPPGMTPEQAAMFQMQLQAIQPILPTPEKKWYDRLADSILGDDPVQAASNKYALVCSECFRHNGLVANKHEWERMQWICPRCDHLNPAPLTRMRDEFNDSSDPETPSKPAKPKVTAPTLSTPQPPAKPQLRSAPSPRRRMGERAAPRQSRLGTEVFSAADADEDEGEEEEELMEVDK